MSDKTWSNRTPDSLPDLKLGDLERFMDELEPPPRVDIRVHPKDRHLLDAFLLRAMGPQSELEAPSLLGRLIGIPITETEFQERGRAAIIYWSNRPAKWKVFESWLPMGPWGGAPNEWGIERIDVIDLLGESDAG